MVERLDSDPLTLILNAARDPTRRAILTHLAQEGPARVTEIAARFEMSLNAVSKHIKVLEGAGLVSRRTLWREHLIEVQMEPLAEIDRWFASLRSIWDQRLERLETLIEKETPMSDLSLTCRRILKASPEQIYAAWLNPAMIAQYMTMSPDLRCEGVTANPRVGGRFAFSMVGETTSPHAGTYTRLDPFSRISFTWESPWSAPESHVDIILTPVAGGTEVVLTHLKFNSEGSRDGHLKGWTGILERLDAMLA